MEFLQKLYNDDEKDYVLTFQSHSVPIHKLVLKINFPDMFMIIDRDNKVLPDSYISLIELIYQQRIENYPSLLEVLRYLENFPLSHNINIKLDNEKDAMKYFINNLTSDDYDNPVIKSFISIFNEVDILRIVKYNIDFLQNLMSKKSSKIQEEVQEHEEELKKGCKFYLNAVNLTPYSLRQLHNILKNRNIGMAKVMIECIGKIYIHHCHSQFILNHLTDFRTFYTDTEILEVIKSNGI